MAGDTEGLYYEACQEIDKLESQLTKQKEDHIKDLEEIKINLEQYQYELSSNVTIHGTILFLESKLQSLKDNN